MKRCAHENLRSFTFSDGSRMSRCMDCDFGEGHGDSPLYSKRGSLVVVDEPEPEELTESPEESSEPETESDETTELTESGLPTFEVFAEADDTPSVVEDESAESAEEHQEVVED